MCSLICFIKEYYSSSVLLKIKNNKSQRHIDVIKIGSLNIEFFSEIIIANAQKVKERSHNINTEVCLENPVLTNL